MVSVEKRNKPVVMLCKDGFLNDALSAVSSKGIPGLKVIPETIPSECTVMEQVETGVDAVLDKIVAALIQPLTAEEASPSRLAENLPRIIFKGNLEEINRFFYKRGWTDGLPIIPPTEEAVAEMLTGTDLPPDHLVAKIPPHMGHATVEKIAVNAVMAGCLPTYMPVLIASIQALLESRYFIGQAVSGGSWAPSFLINGPFRNDIRLNSGLGLMSPGDMANSAIGRAMGFITKNIAGIRKGEEDMGNYGNPCRFSLVLAENEEESPWEPLQVQQGFAKDENTVSVSHPSYFIATPGGGSGDTSPDGLLKSLSYYIPPPEGAVCFLMNPTLAKILAGAGWNKKDIAEFIAEYARAPLYLSPYYWVSGVSIPRRPGVFAAREMPGRKGMVLNVKDNPMESIPKISGPDMIRIFVCGGSYTTVAALMGGPKWVTKIIELPANWKKLTAKYLNVAHNYLKY
jgi:hypothetical protein